MRVRPEYAEYRILGEEIATKILVGVSVEVPEEISIEEFNMLNEHEQKMYILEHEEYRAWMGR